MTEEQRKTQALSKVSRWGRRVCQEGSQPGEEDSATLSPSTPRTPSAFQRTRTIPTEAVTEGPEMSHSQLGEKESVISIKVSGCQKHQVINLLVANVNRDLLTQPIEHALN